MEEPQDTSPATDSGTANPSGVDDWLGYGVYADSLWSRVQTALNRDITTDRPLGDDPLVVGIFGEWGAGKSHLLRMVHERAKQQSLRDIAERSLTATSGLELTVTVPVMFQPWKYEHEKHLHVPLAVHIVEALNETWKTMPTDFEQVRTLAAKFVKEGEDVAAAVTKAEEGFKLLEKGWSLFKNAAESSAGGFLAATLDVGLAATGIPPVASALRGRLVSGDERDSDVTSDEAEKGSGKTSGASTAIKTAAPKKKCRSEQLTEALSHDDGGFGFYRVHRLLQALTRPASNKEALKSAGLPIADAIEFPIRINFVIFIDDLDRCLPEKAVQTLELIKTVFALESFAFVMALDDEVIERGIGHRYKEYGLVGKKPEMPITGFEYLEKIVHLPFKLPPLSRAQAETFVRHAEGRITRDQSQHWFKRHQVQQDLDPSPDGAKDTPEQAQGRARVTRKEGMARDQTIDLMQLTLSAFDVLVPRKLLRVVELWHTVTDVAQRRHDEAVQEGQGKMPMRQPMRSDGRSEFDVRIVLTLLLVQLFQPDLYRVFRRREPSFTTLLYAFVGNRRGLSPSLADIDLWHWAAYWQGDEAPENETKGEDVQSIHRVEGWTKPIDVRAMRSRLERPVDEAAALHLIALLAEEQRGPAQLNRLPLVHRLIEHRAAQRHVFDALKLFAELGRQFNGPPPVFKVGQYFGLLAKGAEEWAPERPASPPREGSPAPLVRMSQVDLQALYAGVIADDEGTQQNLAQDAGLQQGAFLPIQAVTDLTQRIRSWLTGAGDSPALVRARLLLRGMQFLAPYLAAGEGGEIWILVDDHAQVKLDSEPDPHLRALWGDVRASLGCDPRFDPDRWWLPKKVTDKATEFDTTQDDVPGFVRIAWRGTKYWFSDDNTRTKKPIQLTGQGPDFLIARTLTTVKQYECFVNDRQGYRESFEGVALEWLEGRYDEHVHETSARKWLAQRPPDARYQPHDWAAQCLNPLRPVVHVSWFEAQAYTRWLTKKFCEQSEVGGGSNPRWVCSLPTELQWECSARFGMNVSVVPSKFPWGNDESDRALRANVNRQVGHPSTVGLYPRGRTASGLTDMAGNVWEWMVHNYEPENSTRIGLDAFGQNPSESFALRGGAWYSEWDRARCSYRGFDGPVGWFDGIGFRVVLSLSES